MRRDQTRRAGPGGRFQLQQQDHLRAHRPGRSTGLTTADSHCHLNLEPLFSDARQVLERAAEAGVSRCLVPSYGPDEWGRQDELLQYPEVVNGLGIHPWCVPGKRTPELMESLDRAFDTYPARWGDRLRAVGEFGLDRSRNEFKECFETQKELFARHLEWAHKLDLPVIVHLVRAHGAARELLRDGPQVKAGVLHSYPGPKELVGEYAELGFYFSYSGNLLKSEKVRESLRDTPHERILFETDGPEGNDLGQRGPLSPAALPLVVEAAAKVLKKSREWCWSVHRENCHRLFGL